MVATPALELDHATTVVKSWTVPSEYVPIAENCCDNPAGTLGLTGAMPTETSTAEFTVNEVWPLTLPKVATTCVVPGLTALAWP